MTFSSVLFSLFGSTFALLLGEARFLRFDLVQPNFLLVALLIAGERGNRESRWICLISRFLPALTIIAFSFFTVPIWFREITTLSLIAAIAESVPFRITGNGFSDFLLKLLFAHLAFGLAQSIRDMLHFPWGSLAGEIALTLTVGVLTFFLVNLFSRLWSERVKLQLFVARH